MKKKQLIFILLFVSVIVAVIVYSILSGPKIKIQVDDEGLFVKCNFKEDNYTVVWECDAGTLSSVNNNSNYTASTKNSYHVYAGIDEKVTWSPIDNDGFFYTTATIKIYVYKCCNNSRYSKCDSKVYTDIITISIQNDKIVKAEKRAFGNPVREGSDDDWQQIIVLDEQKGYITLRYRYGKSLNSSKQIVWSTNATPLCNAVFQDSPVYVPIGRNQEQFIFDSNTVCYDFMNFNNFYFDDTDVEEYPANIVIMAYVADKKGTRSNIASVSMKFYYGKDSYYTVDPIPMAKKQS